MPQVHVMILIINVMQFSLEGGHPAHCVEPIKKWSRVVFLEYNLKASVNNFVSLQYTSHKLIDGHYINMKEIYSPLHAFRWNPKTTNGVADSALQVHLQEGFVVVNIYTNDTPSTNEASNHTLHLFHLKDTWEGGLPSDGGIMALSSFNPWTDELITIRNTSQSGFVSTPGAEMVDGCVTYFKGILTIIGKTPQDFHFRACSLHGFGEPTQPLRV